MLPSCGSNSNQQSIRRNQIAADFLPGYSVQVDSTTIEVFQESKLACEAFIIRADSQYLARAKQIDSVDIEKGFIIACALEGPLTLIEPDGAEINYSIDSTNIYYTKFNVRCVFMTIKGIESVDSIQTGTLNCYGYFLDISQGNDYRLIEIPCNLGDINGEKEKQVSKMLADNIKFQP